MFAEYIQAALERAQYKIIEDEEPYFASIPELAGVWASGKTVEECRRELISVIKGWVLLRLRTERSIPPVGGSMLVDEIKLQELPLCPDSTASKVFNLIDIYTSLEK